MIRVTAFVLLAATLAPGLAMGKIKRRGPLPSQLPAPTVPRLLSRAPGKEVKIGTWVEYGVREKKRTRNFTMKIAFVGREQGGLLTWIEVTLNHNSQIIYMKMLFEGKPGKNLGDAKKIIMKLGSLHAMEIPMSKAENLLPILFRKPLVKPRNVGTEDFRTRTGLFTRAQKVRGVDAGGNIVEVLHHPNVHLWGLLRFSNAEVTMELIGQGLGARTRITEKPAPFSVPQ
ncbi:hypothetical protein KKF84_09485 [Myxococcota bacterium]|nr:hypothetical protein [Myxococcota bacterium]MBU1535542.1 hypothetical protein [Myxococcota bacterium]